MRFKHTDRPLPEIARELGVDAVVEGSVARSGDHVSVTVQLIDAVEDRHLWAQTYERRMEDILTIEGEVSHAIASQVSDTLALHQAALAGRDPVDSQEFELCLLARYHWNKRTAADLAKARDYYQQAIARDPNYAPAYAGLATVYALLPQFAPVPLQDNLQKAAAAARRALALDERSAQAHATLGFIAVSSSPEYKHSETELRRALELDPSDATTHLWLAYSLFFTGRHDEAVAEIAVARQLDPLAAMTNAAEGHFLYATRHFEAARARLQRAIELSPDLGRPHATLALVELQTDHRAEAIKEAHVALVLNTDDPILIGEAGYVLAATGQTAEARVCLANLRDPARRGGTALAQIALIEIGLGERDRALDAVREIADAKLGLYGLGQYLPFEELNTDPGFKELLARSK